MAKTTENATLKDLKNSSAFKAASWRKLSPAWKITSDLWGTALDVRGLDKQYLRQFPKEPDAKYEERLSNSVFMNEFRSSIETMAGMVFRTNPQPVGADPAFDPIFDDVDLCGNSFWAFLMNAFEMFLRDGNGFFYVDAPPLSTAAREKLDAGQKLTLGDRKDDRVFWVFYTASQVINYRFEKVGSRPVLSQLTVEEKIFVPDGAFGEKEVTQHRILSPGAYRVMQPGDDGEFTIEVESGFTGMDKITLVPIADFTNPPPLLTLALLNTLHYNQTSDYDDICHLVCTPREVRKYEDSAAAEKASKTATASAGVGIKMWGEHADVFYLEVTGGGLDKVHERYQDIEQQMAKIGVGMFEPSNVTGAKTATEILDTSGKRQSKLAGLTRQFENAVEKALYVTAEYINAITSPPNGKPTINLDPTPKDANDPEAGEDTFEMKMRLKIDYERLTLSLDQLNFFSGLVDQGLLSPDTFLRWLSQVADMPPGFDPDEEMKKIIQGSSIITDEPPPPEDDKPAK